jgi:hypothetical protein
MKMAGARGFASDVPSEMETDDRSALPRG